MFLLQNDQTQRVDATSSTLSIVIKSQLIHYIPVLLFYTPRKYQKTLGFLMFSGGIHKRHRAVMG